MATATNITIPSKIDRAAIMRAAWERYRFVRANYAGWQIAQGLIDGSFANALRIAWRLAKEAAAKVEKEYRLATGPNAARAEAIKAQIEMLSYKSLRYDISVQRRHLEAQLSALAA